MPKTKPDESFGAVLAHPGRPGLRWMVVSQSANGSSMVGVLLADPEGVVSPYSPGHLTNLSHGAWIVLEWTTRP